MATPVHVESLKLVKVLHDAGFNVFTFDMRGAGESERSKEGINTSGPHESRDIIGAMSYILKQDKLKSMKIALIAQDMSANATFHAMKSNPDLFKTCTCLFAIQPVQMRYMMSIVAKKMKNTNITEKDIDDAIKQKYNFSLYEMSPMPGIKSLKIPVFFS